MADNTNDGGWEAAPSGAVPLSVQYSLNDKYIQQRHPNWPDGGTATQIGIESGGNNSAVSPKGAQGIAQMMPDTFAAIAKQTGRKLDINNVNDQMFAHRYLMSQNLDRTNGDINGGLSLYNSGRANANNPETINYVNNFNEKVGDNQGWENVPQDQAPQASKGGGDWEPVPKGTDAHARAVAALAAMKPDTENIGKQVTGLGEVAASGLTGMFGQAAGLLHGGAELLQGKGLDAAKEAFKQEVEPVTYQPRTPEGQAQNQRLGEAYSKYIEQPAEKIAQTGAGLITSNPKAQEYAKTYADVLTGIAAATIGGGEAVKPGEGGGKGVRAPGVASELDKLNALNEAPPTNAPYEPMGPFPEGGGPLQGQPNAGPQRGAFTAGPNGIDTGLPLSEEQFWAQRATQMQQDAQAAEAARMGPNAGPQFPGGMRPNEGPQLRTKAQQRAAAAEANRQSPQAGPEYPPNAGPQIPNAQAFARGIMEPAEPNMGPQRPPIPVGENGIATPTMGPEARSRAEFLQAATDQAKAEQAARFGQETPGNPAQPDLFGGFPEGYTGEQRVNFETAEPEPGRNLRQRQFDFEQPNLPDVLYGNGAGEVGTRGQRAEVDPVQRRISDMQSAAPEALDPESGVPHANEGQPANRAVAPDEFAQAVQTLSEREPDKYTVPADMDKAYQKYLDVVGRGLDNAKTYAQRFAKAVADQMREDRVANHPTVKANQARVDQLQSQLDNTRPGMANQAALQRQLDTATKTLEKSKDNIGKALGNDPRLPYEKDGVVNMFTFGHLPELFKSIGAILKAIHGVTFRTLDKMIGRKDNLNSTGKIISQGIKDFVNKEANREWATKVNEQPKKVLDGVPGLKEGLKDYLPFEAQQDLSPADLKSAMQQAPDVPEGKVGQALRNQLLTGQQLQAFTKHPLVKYAVESVDRAMRNSAQFVREQLVGKDGLREKARSLSDDELSGVWTLMQQNEGKREFTPAELKRAGYSDKQVAFYSKFREMQETKLNNLNRGRATAGLPPIDRRVAYIAGHFLGDFKRVITDSDGNVKAVIAHNLKGAVDVISKRVMEQLGPGHELGPIQLRKLTEGTNNDRYVGYMNILNDMAGRDEVTAKVVDAYRDYLTSDAATAMKYRAAFKSKEGVIGAEGRKSWQSAIDNAREGMKNELKSQEALNTWANMQEALENVKKYQTDPEINAPGAKATVQSYLDNVQHRNQGAGAAFANALVNGFSEVTGVGPSILRNMSGATKTGLLSMFIGFGKLSHSFVTLIQPLQGIPVVNSLMKAEGSKFGLSQLTSIAKSFGSQAKFLEGKVAPDSFEGRALKYARDNNTFNSSQFQFGNLTDIDRNRLGANIHRAIEFNVTGMETATRSFTYMYYAHMLRDLGMKESEIFPTAHNAMKDVMVDYNAWERPGVFGKTGLLGDLTAMLTRYKFNQIDQFARAGKYASTGQFGPMATILATSIAAAGVRGVMAYTLANQLVHGVTTWMSDNHMMDKPTSLDELLLHALHGVNKNLSDAVKFGLPSALGINMTGSLSHADDIPNDPLGNLIPQTEPIVNMAKSIYGFAHDPNKATAKTAAYDLAPNSMKGMLENSMFTDKSGNFTNPHSYELQTRRSPADIAKREFGFRPLNEANETLTTRVNQDQAVGEANVRKDIETRILRDIDSNGKRVTPELAQKIQQEYAPKYLNNTGDPKQLAQVIEEHLSMGQARTAAERAQGIPKGSTQSIINYLRYQNLK